VSHLNEAIIRDFLNRTCDASSERPPSNIIYDFNSVRMLLAKAHLTPGSLVLVCLPNSSRLLHAFLAIALEGCVPALLQTLLPRERLRYLEKTLPANSVLEVRSHVERGGYSSVVRAGQLQLSVLETDRPPVTDPGEVVMMTSGTSGIASACVFDLDQLFRNGVRHAKTIGQRARDRVLVTLPLCFSFALVAQALATWEAVGQVIIDGPPFARSAYFSAIRNNCITVSSLTPVLVRKLLSVHAEGGKIWPRVLTVGGDVFTEYDAQELLDRASSSELYVTYGLTQAGPRVTTLPAHNEPRSKLGSIGLAIEGTSLRLRDSAFPDQEGRELLVASDTVMKRRIGHIEGYAGDWSSPGVLATGDLVSCDNDGYFYYQGRICEYVVIGGEKANLSSVRRLACEVPDVVKAKTELLRGPDGVIRGYELLVEAATDDGSGVTNAVTRHLKEMLRPSEMPIRVSLADRTGVAAYK